jgi:hypothetical protein
MSIEQSFRLPFVLPSFNDLEAARGRRDRVFGNGYARVKFEVQSAIVGYIRKARLRPLLPGLLVGFHWLERDRRRDPLDIRAACKLVLDGLCEPDRPGDRQPRASVFHCDGWHCIRGVVDHFDVDAARAGLLVTVYGRPRVPVTAPPGWPFEVRG